KVPLDQAGFVRRLGIRERRLAVNEDFALLHHVLARDQPEKRALADSVGADQESAAFGRQREGQLSEDQALWFVAEAQTFGLNRIQGRPSLASSLPYSGSDRKASNEGSVLRVTMENERSWPALARSSRA